MSKSQPPAYPAFLTTGPEGRGFTGCGKTPSGVSFRVFRSEESRSEYFQRRARFLVVPIRCGTLGMTGLKGFSRSLFSPAVTRSSCLFLAPAGRHTRCAINPEGRVNVRQLAWLLREETRRGSRLRPTCGALLRAGGASGIEGVARRASCCRNKTRWRNQYKIGRTEEQLL